MLEVRLASCHIAAPQDCRLDGFDGNPYVLQIECRLLHAASLSTRPRFASMSNVATPGWASKCQQGICLAVLVSGIAV